MNSTAILPEQPQKSPVQASRLRTIWILILSLWYTFLTCIGAIFRGLLGTCHRQWVDDALQIWLKRVLRLANIQLKIINPQGIDVVPGQPTIIMCNHSSLYDIPFSLAAFPNRSLRMLAKKEMSRIPFMGRAMVAAEFPFIDRKNKHQAIKDLNIVKTLLDSGVVMWIAPEGTRSPNGRLLPFKKGAFITAIQTNATIIPIGIRGASDILPARTHRLQLNQTAEVHIGEPIDASAYTLDNKERLIDRVFQSMRQLVEGPASAQTPSPHH